MQKKKNMANFQNRIQWTTSETVYSHRFQYKQHYSPFSSSSVPGTLHHCSELLPEKKKEVITQKMNANQTAGWITLRIDEAAWFQDFWLTLTTSGFQRAMEGNVKLKAARGLHVTSRTDIADVMVSVLWYLL